MWIIAASFSPIPLPQMTEKDCLTEVNFSGRNKHKHAPTLTKCWPSPFLEIIEKRREKFPSKY